MRLKDADALIAEFEEYIRINRFYGNDISVTVAEILMETIIDAPTIEQPTWISCAERLPTAEDTNEYSEVLAIDQHGKKTVCQLWQFNSSYRPMYWLPFSALSQMAKGVE